MQAKLSLDFGAASNLEIADAAVSRLANIQDSPLRGGIHPAAERRRVVATSGLLFPRELPSVDDRRILVDVGHARTGSGIPDGINGVMT